MAEEAMGPGPVDGSIRSYLGGIIGHRIIEVTCEDEYKPFVINGATSSGESESVLVKMKEIYLHLENGHTVTFYAIEDQMGFRYDGDT